MIRPLQNQLSSRNGVVRKAAIAALRVPKWWRGVRATPSDFDSWPPILANSFPKSGTHLVNQIVEGLPNSTNFGAFLASMTSSFQFHERSVDSVSRFIVAIVPGEIVRGHLFHAPRSAAELSSKNVVHYFVYRDPRDVVVSEAHYLREMNRWHRLHKRFSALPSIEEAISLSITGFDPPTPGIDYPDIAARFARYAGWLSSDECLAIRFEDLVSERQSAVIRQMAEFYARHCATPIDVEACATNMASSVAPHKSHTFRSGKRAGWTREFNAVHRRLFDEIAGELLIQLGYESSHDWARTPAHA